MFFALFDNWKTLFFMKVYRCSEGFSNSHSVGDFELSVSKEVCILRYFHNNSMTLIAKFQNKAVVLYTC